MAILELLDKNGDEIGLIFTRLENQKKNISPELRKAIENSLGKLSQIQKAISLLEEARLINESL